MKTAYKEMIFLLFLNYQQQFLALQPEKQFTSDCIIQLLSAELSKEDAHKIGMLIWNNEASQRTDLLVFWSQYEPFPSLGIGHFIWFPEGLDAAYTQTFPLLLEYLQQHGVCLPEWLIKAKQTGAPWKSRDEFLKDEKRTEELRQLLASTIELQTHFIIERFEHQWPLIVQAAPTVYQAKLIYYHKLLRSSLSGTYAMIDYLNFKGDGLNPREEKKGQRYGLLQVFLGMPDNLTSENVVKAFVLSAAKLLLARIENTAPEYGPIRYLHGWMKRLNTYWNL